jgi:ankyrin repeat protein
LDRFLLAQLHFEAVRTKRTLKKIKDVLNNLPAGPKAYDHAYEEAMERVMGSDPDSKELAKQVLSWITCATRPLTTLELQHALAVEVGKLYLDEDNLPLVEDMVSVCAGLVAVDEESGIIRLVHYTTQEYFKRTQNKWFPNVQSDITAVCTTYLSFQVFGSGFAQTDKEFEERYHSNPLYSYAAHNWGHHARIASKCCADIISFLNKRAQVEGLSQALLCKEDLRSWEGYSQCTPRQWTGLHLAAYLGLNEAVQAIMDGYRPNEPDSYGKTPLSLAAENGHEAVVKLLLITEGVEADWPDFEGKTPLSLAAANGHEVVVKLLLATEGVLVNSRDREDGTPLLLAANSGHEVIVKLLLATEGVLVDSRNIWGHTPLFLAASGGHDVVVQLLLATGGVLVNSRDCVHNTPLLRAAANGHNVIVKLLLATEGVLVNPRGFWHRTPLSLAAESGHEVVVKLLLATKGIEVDWQDSDGRTALSYAVANGHTAVAKLLLPEGVEFDSIEYDPRSNCIIPKVARRYNTPPPPPLQEADVLMRLIRGGRD